MQWRWYILVRAARSLSCFVFGHRPFLLLGERTEREPSGAKRAFRFRSHGCPRCGAFFVEQLPLGGK